MASVVNDSCVLCGACVEVCPVAAFRKGDTQMYIDPNTCIDCGVCLSECPQNAIVSADEADEKWVKLNAEKSAELPEA